MQIQEDKKSQEKSHLIEAESKKQTTSGFASQFEDNRPVNAVHRDLREIALQSPQSAQLKRLRGIAENHAEQQFQVPESKNTTGLPDNLKSGIENLSGYSMEDVKVHYNSDKPAQLQAHAYAQGTAIHLAPGQEKHLPHEAWHVAQQKQGRVRSTMQMKGDVPINDDAGLEQEADTMGNKASAFTESDHIPALSGNKLLAASVAPHVMQPKWIESKEKGVQQWEPQLDGVSWFSDGTDMWFIIANEKNIAKGRIGDYKQLEGEENKRSWDAWNSISIQPDPQWLLLNLDSGYERTEVSVSLETGDKDGAISLNANLGDLVNKFGMADLLRAIPTLLSRQEEAWNMLRAFLILAGNSKRVAGYLESIKDLEQRKKQFQTAILPKLTSLTGAIQIVTGFDPNAEPRELLYYMNAGVEALQGLLAEKIPPKFIAEEILAHDKSYHLSWSLYPGQLREKVAKSSVKTILPELERIKQEFLAKLVAVSKSEDKDYSVFLWDVVGELMKAQIVSDLDGLKKFTADLKTAFPEISPKVIDEFLG